MREASPGGMNVTEAASRTIREPAVLVDPVADLNGRVFPTVYWWAS